MIMLNKVKKWIGILLPHAVLVFALACLTLVILTLYNPRMGFMTGSAARTAFAVLAVLSIISSVSVILKR